MEIILCPLTFLTCLALKVDSQLPYKPIGEWSPLRAERYPNPWENSTACKTKALSGLCDYNGILTVEQRDYFSEEPEIKKKNKAHRCLCSKTCGAPMRLKFTVAIMKKIGPEISDYRVAAIDFAQAFRKLWHLRHCTVILIVSKGDNMGYADPGTDVNTRTGCSVNVTDKIDQNIYETYFKNGLFAQGINETLHAYRKCATTTTESESEVTESSSNSSKIVGGVIVDVLVVGLVKTGIIVFIVITRRKRRKMHESQNLASREE